MASGRLAVTGNRPLLDRLPRMTIAVGQSTAEACRGRQVADHRLLFGISGHEPYV